MREPRDTSWGHDCETCGTRLNAEQAQRADAKAGDGPLMCGACRDEDRFARQIADLRAENERLRRGFCDEAHILMVQALDVKALGKGRRAILTEQAVRMAKVGLSKGWPRYDVRGVERRAEDVLALLDSEGDRDA